MHWTRQQHNSSTLVRRHTRPRPVSLSEPDSTDHYDLVDDPCEPKTFRKYAFGVLLVVVGYLGSLLDDLFFEGVRYIQANRAIVAQEEANAIARENANRPIVIQRRPILGGKWLVPESRDKRQVERSNR
jgi:hypothetical protein